MGGLTNSFFSTDGSSTVLGDVLIFLCCAVSRLRAIDHGLAGRLLRGMWLSDN